MEENILRKNIERFHTISEVLGYLLITPPETGSRTSYWIFKHFPFAQYGLKNSKIYYKSAEISHSHNPYLFEGHEKYKLIMTVKNPYSKWVSRYKKDIMFRTSIPSTYNFQKGLLEFIYEQYYTLLSIKNSEESSFQSKFATIDKEITHRISTENILEDYRAIPFIRDSELNKSGELEKILSKPIGHHLDLRKHKIQFPYDDWRYYYTDESAELIYSLISEEFEKFGYDKDSWKI
jgi:hypothetical protein